MMEPKTKKLLENMFEISAIAENLQAIGSIQVDDSRELFHVACNWAEAFEQQFDEDGGKDYLMEIEAYARQKLLETFPPTAETHSAVDTISCTLSNGARLTANLGGDAEPVLTEKQGWASIDVGITLLDGRFLNLCAADFEEAGSKFQKDTLRIMLFADGEDDPKYTLTVDDFSGEHSATAWLHYACWLQHELADNTYDICMWDEIRNERGENLEEARFASREVAEARLAEIQKENRHIRWTRLNDKIGKG